MERLCLLLGNWLSALCLLAVCVTPALGQGGTDGCTPACSTQQQLQCRASSCQCIPGRTLNLTSNECDEAIEYFERHPEDGWYNNLLHPDWGAIDGELLRRSPPAYEDGVFEPSGPNRANPFDISDAAHKGLAGQGSARDRTAMLVFFGQQLVEEIMDAQRPGCPREFVNIPVPKNHPYNPDNLDNLAMPFLRSRYNQRTGHSPNNPRQQLNEITPYIDGNLMYGFGKAVADAVRAFDGDGKLAAQDPSLPISQSFPMIPANVSVSVQFQTIMLATFLLVGTGLSLCCAHVTTTKTPPLLDHDGEELSLLGKGKDDPHRIVIHTDDTSIHVGGQSTPCESAVAEVRKELGDRMNAMETQVAAVEKLLGETIVARPGGSLYVRWGSKTCPESAQMVYSGVVGGSHFSNKGGPANPLCLPLTPVYDGHPVPQHGPTHLYGAEYEVKPEKQNDQEIVCAVCVTSLPLTLMVPATNTCHPGWTVQYTGYLMGGYFGQASSEFLCLDSAMEGLTGSHLNQDGYRLYYTIGKCGSLPCPPYEDGKVITCVVCSQ